jgi:tetratricopeptide (TPR) repeat protein
VESTTKNLLVRGAGLAVLLATLFGIFAFAVRKDDSASGPTGTPAVDDDLTADEEFALGLDALKNEEFDQALARFSATIRLDPANALAFYYRGGILFGRSEHDKALADFSGSIRLDPGGAKAFVARATIHSQKQDYDLAIADLSEAIRLDPEDAFSFNNRAFVYRQLHEYEKAIADYAEAIRLKPQHDAPLGGLAWILATCPKDSLRDGPRAVELARRACKVRNWKDRIGLETLAAACAECNDFPAAIKWQKQALAMMLGDPERVEEGRQRLALYEDGQPCREE